MTDAQLDAIVDMYRRAPGVESPEVVWLVAEVRRLRSLVERLADAVVEDVTPTPQRPDEDTLLLCHACDCVNRHESDCPYLEAHNEQAVKP